MAGSVSSIRVGVGLAPVTSNASTAICAPPDVVVPVTVITSVWGPTVRVGEVNTGSDVSPGLPGAAAPAVSTEVAVPPSMETVAIPQMLHFSPIQLTFVPVKENVAVAPATFEVSALPPLNVAILEPLTTQALAGLKL